MPESLDAFAELRAIRARLEGIEHRQEMLVRAQADQILDAIWAYIDVDKTLGEVYLLVDGTRTEQDIVDELERRGKGVSQPTVSRKLNKLMNEMGLIDIVDRTSAGTMYRKSELDRILHLTPKVEKRLTSTRNASTQANKSAPSK